MGYKETRTKSGISVLTAEPIIDLEKEFDDRQTLVKRPRFLGLGHKKTIYVPNDYAPKPRMSKLAAAIGGTALLLGVGSGCAGSSPFTKITQEQPEEKGLVEGLREYTNRLDEIGKEYGENARKIVEDTINKYMDVLGERKDQANKEVGSAIRYREFVREIEQALERYEKKESTPLTIPISEKSNKDKSTSPRKILIPNSLELYVSQKRGDKVSKEPRVVNGLGARLTAPIGKGFDAYIKLERDEKDKEVATPSGNLFLSSKANTYGAGIGYNLIDSKSFKLDARTGLYLRDETNKINGVNGISVVDEKDKISYLGAEAGLGATLYLSDNFGFFAGLSYKNENLTGRLKGSHTAPNTKAAWEAVLGVTIPFGKGK